MILKRSAMRSPMMSSVLLEPIQGSQAYASRPAIWPGCALTSQHRVLFIADEISQGSGVPAGHSHWSTRTSPLTSTCWARRWAVASCRCRRSLLIMTCSVC